MNWKTLQPELEPFPNVYHTYAAVHVSKRHCPMSSIQLVFCVWTEGINTVANNLVRLRGTPKKTSSSKTTAETFKHEL